MTSIRIVLAVTAAAVIAVLGPGMAAAAEPVPLPVPLPLPLPVPLPEDDLSRFESAAVAANVSITVDRRGRWLRPGQKANYTIKVENHGERPEPLMIRVSLPPWMTEVVADNDGEVSDGFVDWPATVEPDVPITRRLTGTYTRPGPDEGAGGPVRVAFTACALDEEGSQPIACATDIAELGSSAPLLWLVAGIAAILAAASGAVRWLRRRRHSGPPATAEQPAVP